MDDNVKLAPASDLLSYALVYLVGQGNAKLSPDEMKTLYAYLQGGGTVLMESCRMIRGRLGRRRFLDLLGSLGPSLASLRPVIHCDRTVLFAARRLDSNRAYARRQGERGVIWSTCDYGCLWQGERRDGPAAREAIRTAMEWGAIWSRMR